MNHYAYSKNSYHQCDAEGCKLKSKYSVYPAGQPAGHSYGSTMMCGKHFKLFKSRYWKSVEAFYNAVMNGEISIIVKSITHKI